MGFFDMFRRSPPTEVLASTPSTALALRAPADIVPTEFKTEPVENLYEQVKNLWRSYPADDISPESYRALQRQADIGQVSRLMELFDDIASDYHVSAQLRTRKLAVAGAPRLMESGDDSDLGRSIADDAELFIQRIPGFTQLCTDILDDFYRGFSCVRPIWDSIDGKWWVVGHEPVESRFFYFDNAVTPLITRDPGGIEGVPIPSGYIFSTFRDKAGPVVRGGVGRSVGKLWIAKGYTLIETTGYIERFGSPHVQVNLNKTLHEGDPLLGRIKDAARSFITDQIGILPSGATLQVVEAVNKAATVRDVFLAFMDFCDLGISKAILGQVLTADAGPGGIGHGGAAREQGEVRQDLRELDAQRLAEVLGHQLLAPWTLYHYGPTAPVPRLVFNVSKPDDQVQKTLAQKQRAETIAILRNIGLPISKTQTYEDFELVTPEDEEDTLQKAEPVADPTKQVPETYSPKAAPNPATPAE